MLPAMQAGTVEVRAIDPKRMELSYGRTLFASYADDGESAVALLERAVADMQERADRYAGKQRVHVPSTDDPFVVVVLDEVAFLTAYHPDRDVRRRAENAIATLTSQGRSVGFCVLAALQDPRKEVMNLRNLFPDKVALRLDEASQVDMVLGEGARERGALAHLIDADLPGVAFVKLEGSPAPVRVRAAYVSDDDIDAMAGGLGTAGA
jgi:S-DNA-T family DNA segregation ATPase FtsK/SpoIIIE